MTLFINGNVLTLDEKKQVESFIVKDGIFTAVGSNDEMKKLASSETEIIDLQGKTIVPGFNDAHMHFLNYAITKDNVDLLNVPSIVDMIIRSKSYIDERNIAEGKWIISRGWNDNLFDEKRLPTRHDLDKISTKHPIYFSRVCGHIAVANSKALELVNIDSNTQNPDGGIIDKLDGQVTGILRENACNLITDTLPPLDKEDIKRLLKNAFNDALRVGLTTIQTDDLGHSRSIKNSIEAYRELESEQALPIRVILQTYLPDEKSLSEAVSLGIKTGIGTDKFKIGPLKLYEDGSLGGRTGAMLEPYCDENTTGVLILDQKTLNDYTLLAHNAGFQIAIHAIGDSAAEHVLNAYENISNNSENKNLRLSIIHCQFTNDDILDRFKNLGIVANVQPSFVMTDYPIVEKAVGKSRAEKSYVWKDMVDKGLNVAFSSDAPIESFNPIEGIYAAVTRKDLNGNPSDGWNSEQCLTVEEALKCFTIGPAYANFNENKKGTISKGKLADFVVLSDNILEIEKDNIKDIQVLQTYVAGKKEY